MALDEPNESDKIYEVDGFKYIINQEFLEKAKPVKVDYGQIGFKITSGFDMGAPSACSSCGTGGSCSTES
ncbi:MAG: hypothetical protein ABIK92_08595 [Pseudomonadota bacterium]